MQRFSTSILIFFMAQTAFCTGGLSGGGGELLGDSQNPWFIEASQGEPQSAPVNYCIDVGVDFIVAKEKLQDLVRRSISWWNVQLSSAHLPENELFPQKSIKIKLQTFRFFEKNSCEDQNIDLRFQFGILSDQQLAELKAQSIDTRKFVGIAIRTDYSNKMRGKGYIYISPDRGEMAMNAPNILPHVWEQDQRASLYILTSVIKHEFGHVMGVPHTLSGIMSAKTPEKLATAIFDGSLYDQLMHPIFFPGVINIKSCDRKVNLDLFLALNISQADPCVSVYADLNTITISVSRSRDAPDTVIAREDFRDGYKRRFRDLVTLSLPEKRDVLKVVPEYIHTLKGPELTEVQQQATFTINGRNCTLILQKDPDRFQISAVLDGQFYSDIYPQGSAWAP